MGEHIPVLLSEAIEALDIKEGGTYVDLTLGRGGHSKEILKRLGSGKLYCFDQDETAIKEGGENLKGLGNFEIIKANFSEFALELRSRGVDQVDGILADLGVSSPQFDDPERGFSYRVDAKLDMRMDRSSPLTAEEVVNSYPLERLAKIISDYGEDKDAYSIAKQIVRRRENNPIHTTFELVEAIKAGKSPKSLRQKGHPAKQTFQAIRIEVNHEKQSLEEMLEAFPEMLRPGGRIAIITFMSLDDRIVKRKFASLTTIEGNRSTLPMLPGEEGVAPFEKIYRKPILPSEQELEANHRAASAKLRAIKKKD
ncbi:MAG: 16S rRNA (cytosine(1402)-N(4))-methyltransferase RsmH [Bacilli bacterium]|nr:16S rRNA (cytosine(1402)-N(4))-methyltransferase RsmH [Bacilli bacterium]